MQQWYVITYHDVSWHADRHLSALRLAMPPDLLADHVDALSAHGPVVAPNEAVRRLSSGTGSGPLFSIWFDDGYRGVRRHGLPVLRERGIQAGQAVNSAALTERTAPWRLRLAWLAAAGQQGLLRQRLRPLGLSADLPIRRWTMDNYGPDVLAAIVSTYDELATAEDLAAADRLLDDERGIRALVDAGWDVSNHSARHLPIGEVSASHLLEAEFRECDAVLLERCGITTPYWVLPFDRPGCRDPGLVDRFREIESDRLLVLVGNRPNTAENVSERVVYRYMPPPCTAEGLLRWLGL